MLRVLADKESRAELRALVGSLHQIESGTVEATELKQVAAQPNAESRHIKGNLTVLLESNIPTAQEYEARNLVFEFAPKTLERSAHRS